MLRNSSCCWVLRLGQGSELSSDLSAGFPAQILISSVRSRLLVMNLLLVLSRRGSSTLNGFLLLVFLLGLEFL